MRGWLVSQTVRQVGSQSITHSSPRTYNTTERDGEGGRRGNDLYFERPQGSWWELACARAGK